MVGDTATAVVDQENIREQPNGKIIVVKVDFLKPIKGFEKILIKCELPIQKNLEKNGGHSIWTSGNLVEELTIDLERNEWESDWFSSVWFSIEDVDL